MKNFLLALLSLAVLPTYAGTITGNLQGPSGLPIKAATLNFQLNQAGLMVGTGAVVPVTASCYTDALGNVVGLPNMQAAPTAAVNLGSGSLPGGIYYVTTTWLDGSGGETAPSPELRIQLSSAGSLQIAVPTSVPAGAVNINVYAGTVKGNETMQGTQSLTAPFILSSLSAGAAQPTSNSTICRITFNDQVIPYTGYTVSLISSSGNAYPGYPQSWQLNGGQSGSVNVSQGAPLWNGVVVYPMPILSQPLNHGPQSISGSLNMSGYDLLNIGNLTALSVNGAYLPNPTIQSAINEAGPSGSVFIPPAYQGTDTFTNPSNIHVDDDRPYNPNNSATYVGGPMPQTTIKASEFGAVCNQTNDDTAAIQAAVNAAARITYLNNQGLFMGPAIVELPQGACTISQTIVMADYGSLKGNNTTITPRDPWIGTNTDLVDLTTTYFGSTTTGNHLDSTSQLGRFVSGIKFEYNGSTVSHTAIRVFDPTGSSATTPYPAGALFSRYQMPGVSINNNVFYALDTAIVFQDCGECIARDNQILAVRMGIEDSGNNFGLTLDNNVIQEGSWRFSAPADRTGATVGVLEQLEVRWICSNTAKNCAGGTATQTLIATPQGLGIIDGNQEAFDNDVNIGNIQGLLFSGGGSDFGGDGPAAAANPSTIYPSIVLAANLIEVNMTHYYVATAQPNGIGVLIQAPAGGVGTNLTWNDLTIDNTYFSNYAGSGMGIVFAAGTLPRRGVKLVDNQCQGGLNTCIQINHPVQYSIISGNYTADLTGGGGALIQLNATGSTSFLATKIENNSVSLNPYPVILDTAGGGYTLGSNFSPGGFQGAQSSAAAGCTISAGAIGNTCGTPVTITWSQTFADSSYTINNCAVTGATGPVAVSNTNILSPTTVSVTEVALSTSATGGGTITCSATHQ